MRNYVYVGLCLLMLAPVAFAASDVVSAIKGTIRKLDAESKRMIVATADGTEHAVQFASHTVVYGFGETKKGAREVFQSLREGSDVVVYYTKKGAEKIAVEVDHVGTDGLKRAEGTIARIDRVGKRIIIKTAKGTEETYRLADHAARGAGKSVVGAAAQSGRVIVYYAEEGGRKVAHFFEKAL